MAGKRKICIVTGTRAEYGLLYWLMKEIQASKKLELQLIVTGMHLSPEFGLTYQQIEQDGFNIDRKVEMLLSSDTEVGVTKSMGVGLMGFAEAFSAIKPDLLVLLGDRFESFAAASAATVAKVPVAHLHGGETTEGAIDEAFRHSITKMSHLHFTSTDIYRQRVIQLGEQPDKVFNVGAIGIDNIKRLELLERTEFEKEIGFSLNKRNLLITFHPVTLEDSTAETQFSELLSALDMLEDTNLIFTKANADPDGRIINTMIEQYVSHNKEKSIAFTSMGQLRYLSAMQHVDGVVGNSSSGLLEAPTFRVGTINIGDRQLGRVRAASVIDTDTDATNIKYSFDRLYSTTFQHQLATITNPYGNGGTAEKIVSIIECLDDKQVLKKKFYDLSL